MIADILQALRQRREFASLQPADLEMLPGKGTAHIHVRIRPIIDGRHLLARICLASRGDAGAAARLTEQENAFRIAVASATTPGIHCVIAPGEAVPGGMLVVDEIAGLPPKLPGDLAALADALATLHLLPPPVPTDAINLPRANDRFGERLVLIEQTLSRFLPLANLSAGAVGELEDEVAWLRRVAPAQDGLALSSSLLLTDTHPGNFLVDASGKAWFVDLEKTMIGGARACDLAHATLYTSTRWDPDVDTILDVADVGDFYRHYLHRQPDQLRQALLPALLPARRLIWLRTTSFCIRWKVETAQPHEPGLPQQWSAAGLDARMLAHNRALLADLLAADTMRRIRSEWLEGRLVI